MDRFMSRRRFVHAAALACMGTALWGLSGCSADQASAQSQGEQWLEQDPQTQTLFVFDTVVTLSAYCSEELMNSAVERCNYFENKFSRTVEGSDIWNVNHAGGKPTEVASETADAVAKSLEYCEKSGGLFDITIGAVSSLWDFEKGVKPSDRAIRKALPHIDYRKVRVEGATITLEDPEAMLDLGGTAKGYIADDLDRLFSEGGCLSAMINLGGNVYVLGSKPDGSAWKVGVQDPNGSENTVVAKTEARDLSVVTSGLYERKFTASDGKTYYHILDPSTGYPAKTDLTSSSVVCKSSLTADAYATWMFLLGHDKALALLKKTDGLEGMVVDDEDKVSQTAGKVFTLVKGD